MGKFEDQVIKHDVEISAIKEDVNEIKTDVKEIKKMLNGYLDKKIEEKVKSMHKYFEEIATNSYAKMAGKRALLFAAGLISSFIGGALAGRFFWG